jgi:NADH-quinone oxidoreductase subunit F
VNPNNPAAAAAFKEIKERAEAKWSKLDHNRPVIMVGTATCGRAAGSLEVLKAFREEVKKHNLDCPVVEVGCMGHCYAEPLVIIRKPGAVPVSYGHVNAVIAERLVNEYILGDNLPGVRPGRPGTNEILPASRTFRAHVTSKTDS